MIIGKNNNSFNQSENFERRFNTVKEQAEKNKERINPFQVDNKALRNTNVFNKNDMADKSFAMLQERYNNGTISLEEFNKQCNRLNRLRSKQ